jgi:AcrR family transcriptional regulator
MEKSRKPVEPAASPTGIVPVQNRAFRTRERLLQAVESLVATTGGADAVTTTSVAQESGVAVGTIYRYFAHRDALLLAAYDATVVRIVEACAAGLAGFDEKLPTEDAAHRLLALYLDTADSIPAHKGLLKAMRAIRPIEADQSGGNEMTIVGGLLVPFWARYAGNALPAPDRLHFMSVLLGTLVDLYLMTPAGAEREQLRDEIDAHMLLALTRSLKEMPAPTSP